MSGWIRLFCVWLALFLAFGGPSCVIHLHDRDNNIQKVNWTWKEKRIPLNNERILYGLGLHSDDFLHGIVLPLPNVSDSVFTSIMSGRRTGSASTEKSGQRDICPICNIKITHKTHSLCCEICGIWYCLKCSKVPQAAYDALVEASGKQGSSCVFLCPCCKPSLPILSNINQTVNEIKTSTSERFDNLETKVSDMEHTMDKLITREEVDSMKQDLKDEAASNFEKILEKKLKERDEVAKRELNLIFWGIPESDSDDTGSRRKHDSDFVIRTAEAIGIQDIKISQVIRLGQRPKNETRLATSGKPRGILVKFNDKSQRRDVLRGSKKLQSCDKTFSKVSITKDLTFSQREENKTAMIEIRKEYEERVNKGEKNIKLRGRRIIKVSDNPDSESDGEAVLSTSLSQAMLNPF